MIIELTEIKLVFRQEFNFPKKITFSQQYNHFFKINFMCFFKSLPTPPVHPSSTHLPPKHAHLDTSSESSLTVDPLALPCKQTTLSPLDQRQWMLMNCLNMVNLNSKMIFAMDQKLNQAEQTLKADKKALEEPQIMGCGNLKRLSTNCQNSREKVEQVLFESADPLTRQLFGNSTYKYQLVLDCPVPESLYKERNFNLSVKLIEKQTGKEMLNGNMIGVCLGVCDDNGEWVLETKEGVSFLKGKMQAQLYHGGAGFVKMAARDVSRGFINKSVNFVVYPKPTVLKYSGESSIEEQIDFSLIEPLMIRNISIKAKRRE